MVRKKVNIYTENNMIYIHIEDVPKLAFTEYNKDLFEIISSSSWHVKPKGKKEPFGYVNSSKLGSLHQVVMKFWYGEKAYNSLLNKGFRTKVKKSNYSDSYIIEHSNNEGFDCRISNLYLYNRYKNSNIKGKYLDPLVKEFRPYYALSIFNDFDTKRSQITVGFNSLVSLEKDNKMIPLQDAKFLYEKITDYDMNYSRLIHDAETIIEMFIKGGKIPMNEILECVKCKEIRLTYSSTVQLKESERHLLSGGILSRNNGIFLIPGESCYVTEVPPDDDWFK